MNEYGFTTKEEIDSYENRTRPNHDVNYVANHEGTWVGTAVAQWALMCRRLLRERDAYREGWIKAEMRWDSFVGVPFSQESVARDVAAATIDILTGAEGDTKETL